MPASSPREVPVTRTTNQVRQGVTGHHVRTVLTISLGAAVVLLAIAGILLLR